MVHLQCTNIFQVQKTMVGTLAESVLSHCQNDMWHMLHLSCSFKSMCLFLWVTSPEKKKKKPPIFWLSFSYYTYENWCHTIRLTGFPTWSPHQDLRLSSARRARTSYIPGLGRHRACPEATLHKRLLPPSMNDLQTNASAWFFPSPNACLCFNIYSWFCLKGRRLPIPELKGIQFCCSWRTFYKLSMEDSKNEL